MSSETNKFKVTARQITSLIGCIILLLICMGTTSIYFAFAAGITERIGGDTMTFMIGTSLLSVVQFVAGFPLAKVVKIITPKGSLFIGVLCSAAALFVISMADSTPMWICGAILAGGAQAFGSYAALTGAVAIFWKERSQTAVGIVTGAGAYLTSAVITIASRCLDVFAYYDILFVLGFAWLIIGILDVLFLIGPMPRDKKGTVEEIEEVKEETDEADKELPGLTLGQALHRKSFYLLMISIVFAACAYFCIASYMTLFFTGYGMAPSDAGTLVGLLSAMVATYKIISGPIMKKVSLRVMSFIIYACWAVGVICLMAWSVTSVFALAAVGIMLCAVAGLLTIAPSTFSMKLFGIKDIAAISFIGVAMWNLGNVIITLGFNQVVNALNGYFNAFIVLIFIGVIGLILTQLAVGARKREEKTIDKDLADMQV